MKNDNGFFDLKSQEEIDSEKGFQWFKWYMGFSFVITIIFYLLVGAALVKYLLS